MQIVSGLIFSLQSTSSNGHLILMLENRITTPIKYSAMRCLGEEDKRTLQHRFCVGGANNGCERFLLFSEKCM
jgi:hypothetical protein